jgi:hypothetical protein
LPPRMFWSNVRLFRNGRNQAVRIPVEFELPGDEAILRREGDRLVIRNALQYEALYGYWGGKCQQRIE